MGDAHSARRARIRTCIVPCAFFVQCGICDMGKNPLRPTHYRDRLEHCVPCGDTSSTWGGFIGMMIGMVLLAVALKFYGLKPLKKLVTVLPRCLVCVAKCATCYCCCPNKGRKSCWRWKCWKCTTPKVEEHKVRATFLENFRVKAKVAIGLRFAA
jgi:hypothetical protein